MDSGWLSPRNGNQAQLLDADATALPEPEGGPVVVGCVAEGPPEPVFVAEGGGVDGVGLVERLEPAVQSEHVRLSERAVLQYGRGHAVRRERRPDEDRGPEEDAVLG